MRAILLSILLLAGPAGPAVAQDDPVTGVIQRQFDAFLADDFAGAFAFASPTIRNLFGTASNFGAMVRNGYPMVHRPADVEYLDQRAETGATYQIVEITDRAGKRHYLEYEMVETPGGWQINGVRFVQPPSIGV